VRDHETYQPKSLMIMPFSNSDRGEKGLGDRGPCRKGSEKFCCPLGA
jgi:hypothetical protein